MKKTLFLAALFILVLDQEQTMAESKSGLEKVKVLSFVNAGKYLVLCENNEQELVTQLDLDLNNVCPRIKEAKPSNIKFAFNLGGEVFQVVCIDDTSKLASIEQIKNKEVCKAVVTPLK